MSADAGGNVDDQPLMFEDYVLGRQAALLRVAYLLIGDRQLAEDLVQGSLERAYQHWRRVTAAGHPDAYVRRIMVNLANDWRRSRRYTIDDTQDVVALAQPDGDSHAEHAERRDLIMRALRALPPRMRAVLVLRYYEDLSEAETAAIMGCSVGNVKSQASRALDRIRTAMDLDRKGARQ